MKQTVCSQCNRRDFLKLASAAGLAVGLGNLPLLAAAEKIVPNLKVVAIIDQAKCNKKAICVKKCPFKAIVKTGEKTKPVYQVIAKKCVGCGTCVKSCPSKAIALVDRKPARPDTLKK